MGSQRWLYKFESVQSEAASGDDGHEMGGDHRGVCENREGS